LSWKGEFCNFIMLSTNPKCLEVVNHVLLKNCPCAQIQWKFSCSCIKQQSNAKIFKRIQLNVHYYTKFHQDFIVTNTIFMIVKIDQNFQNKLPSKEWPFLYPNLLQCNIQKFGTFWVQRNVGLEKNPKNFNFLGVATMRYCKINKKTRN